MANPRVGSKGVTGWEGGLARDRKRAIPLFILFLYFLGIEWVGNVTTDHLIAVVPVFLYYLGPRFRPLYEFLLPLFLTMIIYDSQRYFADLIRGPIHVVEPYAFDKYFFGIQEGFEILTPNEWFQRHTHPILDVITGFFYIAFVPIFVAIAARFQLGPAGRGKFSSEAKTLMWAFFWLNMAGYSTYYWYAASPPWYVAEYGFGPARLDVLGSPAGCVRFDLVLGTKIFNEWYSRSADVHGAVPSLHIAYPCLALVYSLKFKSLRLISAIYLFALCFSAVYLNHHYILDLLWGAAYAVLVGIYFLYFRKSALTRRRH